MLRISLQGRTLSWLLALSAIALCGACGVRPAELNAPVFEARPDAVISLAGDWLFFPGDDPQFAERTHDDSAWRRVNGPAPWNLYAGARLGVGWYRLRIRTPADGANVDYGLILPYIQAASEVYFNGERIGGRGVVAPNGRLQVADGRMYLTPIPRAKLAADGDNLLALRIHGGAGPGGIVAREIAFGEFSRAETRFFRWQLWHVTLAGIFLFVAAIHMIHFAGRRVDRHHLYFALFAACVAAIHASLKTLSYWLFDSYLINQSLFNFSTAAFPALLILFFRRFYGLSAAPVEKLAVGLALTFAGAYAATLIAPALFSPYQRFMLPALVTLSIAAVLYCVPLTVKATHIGFPGARLLSLGFYLFGLGAINEILSYYDILQTPRMLDESFLCFIIAMQFALAMRSQTLHGELETVHRSLQSKADAVEDARRILEESERMYRSLIEASHDILLSLDTDGRILTANRALTERLGFNRVGVIGEPFESLIYETVQDSEHGLSRQVVRDKFLEALSARRDIAFRAVFRTRIGEPRTLDLRFQYVGTESALAPIFARLSGVDEDELTRLLIAERQRYVFGNYIGLAELVSNRLAAGVARYGGSEAAFGVKLCLREIIINAIEHGNLRINYAEKSRVQREGAYIEFLRARQHAPETRDKTVTVEYSLDSKRAWFRITDMGAGFDHRAMRKRTAAQINESGQSHGRGILLARNEFDVVRYNEIGNSVLLIKRFSK
jgi:PAS domain S-box-containing protein